MKILFYASPTRLFEDYARSVDVLRDHLWLFCGEALHRSGEVELKAIVSEIAAWQNASENLLAGIDVIPLPFDVLRRVFPGARSLTQMHLDYFLDELTDEGRAILARELRSRLSDWEPDIVIAYPTNFWPLRRIFPGALCLTMENGMFSRPPFPRALRFEPVEFRNGFLNRYRDEIRGFSVTPRERAAVKRLRDGLRELLTKACPVDIRAELGRAKSRFRHLVLCPVPTGNFCGEAAWDDQFLWLTDVMERVPPDVGVIVTFHDEVGSQLNFRTFGYFQSRFPNLLAFGTREWRPLSHIFFPFVDAILNCETMTGTLGMLICPRIVSLDRSYSAWMADACGLESLGIVLDRPGLDRTGMICWYLTRFNVYARHFGDSAWYVGYFQRLIAAFSEYGISFDLLGQLEDVGEVVDYLLDFVRSQFEEMRLASERERYSRRCLYGKVANRLRKLMTHWRRMAEKRAEKKWPFAKVNETKNE